MSRRIFTGFFSGFSGLSTAVPIGYATALETNNLTAGIISGGMALVADTIATYYFQGQSILKAAEEPTTLPSVAAQETEEQTSKCDRQTCYSITAQSIYTIFDAAKIFGNNYFFLSVIPELFSISFSRPLFYSALAVLTSVKELFNLTNAAFETNKSIAEKFTAKNTKPCYARFFKCCAGPKSRQTISFIGSLFHTLFDDLLPWIALLPATAIQYLAEHVILRYIVIGVGTVLGIPLTLLVFLQTWLYEGRDTEKNLLLLNTSEYTLDSPDIPLLHNLPALPSCIGEKTINMIKKTISTMGPLHGVAAAVPIYIGINQIADNEHVAALAWCAFIISAVIITVGTLLSEVKEAREALDNIGRFDEVTQQTAGNETFGDFNDQQTLGTQQRVVVS